MTRLPDPQQPTAPQAGQPLPDTDPIWNAYDRAILEGRPYTIPTYYRDDTKPPAIGATPPVAQPGRPPMSQRAVDLNTTILSTSVVIASLGGAVTGILWASHYANPTVIQWICGCAVAVPAALAVAALAFKGLMKSAKEVVQAAPPQINNHYSGPIYQDNRQQHLSTRNLGVIATTHNRPELPPAH